MQFESDGSEEGPRQSPLRPVSQPSVECVDTPKGDENDKFRSEEDETRFDELNDDQTAPESPEPVTESPEIIPADVPPTEACTQERNRYQM